LNGKGNPPSAVRAPAARRSPRAFAIPLPLCSSC